MMAPASETAIKFPHELQLLFESCEKSMSWPQNLVKPDVLDRILISCAGRLRSQSERLFSPNENEAMSPNGRSNRVVLNLLDVEGYGQGGGI